MHNWTGGFGVLCSCACRGIQTGKLGNDLNPLRLTCHERASTTEEDIIKKQPTQLKKNHSVKQEPAEQHPGLFVIPLGYVFHPVFISPDFLWTASETHSRKRKTPATTECLLSTFSPQSVSYSSHTLVLAVSWGNARIKDKREQGKEWSKRQTTKQNHPPSPPKTSWLNFSANRVHDYSAVKTAFFFAST